MAIQDFLPQTAPERSAPLFTLSLLTLACALADNQNASTMVALFSHFSDILRLPFSSRFAIVLLIASQRTRFCYAGGCLNASFADFTLRNEIEA